MRVGHEGAVEAHGVVRATRVCGIVSTIAFPFFLLFLPSFLPPALLFGGPQRAWFAGSSSRTLIAVILEISSVCFKISMILTLRSD
jgi:hypothetical protein